MEQIIEGFGDRRPDTAMESAEIKQLKSLLQEREKEIERLEVGVAMGVVDNEMMGGVDYI